MSTPIIIAVTVAIVTLLLCATALRALSLWLAFRREGLWREAGTDPNLIGVRIELADTKERLKKLEAIANGVEL